MNNRFAFIGAGNMGGAIIEALCRAVPPENVVIYDRDENKTAELSNKTACRIAASAQEAASNAHFVFLCVKPNVLHDALKGICPVLSGKVVVSIAAGVAKNSIKAITRGKKYFRRSFRRKCNRHRCPASLQMGVPRARCACELYRQAPCCARYSGLKACRRAHWLCQVK